MARRRKQYFSEPVKQSKNVKNQADLTTDVYRGSFPIKELQRMRRALAKRANQRIVRLERGQSEVTGEKWNTFGAVVDVYKYLNDQQEGRTRFKESANALSDYGELRWEITVLQGFLGRKTSLVYGMRDIEKKRINTFESGKWGTAYKKNGTPTRPIKFASNKEFYDFLNSETFKGLVSSGFTSEQIIEEYDKARVKTVKKIARKIAEGAEVDEDDAKIVAEQMQEALDDFRRKGNANLKDLRKRLNSIELKGSANT